MKLRVRVWRSRSRSISEKTSGSTVASEAAVRELWLVHTHPLYSSNGANLKEARQIFNGNVYVARDRDEIQF